MAKNQVRSQLTQITIRNFVSVSHALSFTIFLYLKSLKFLNYIGQNKEQQKQRSATILTSQKFCGFLKTCRTETAFGKSKQAKNDLMNQKCTETREPKAPMLKNGRFANSNLILKIISIKETAQIIAYRKFLIKRIEGPLMSA